MVKSWGRCPSVHVSSPLTSAVTGSGTVPGSGPQCMTGHMTGLQTYVYTYKQYPHISRMSEGLHRQLATRLVVFISDSCTPHRQSTTTPAGGRILSPNISAHLDIIFAQSQDIIIYDILCSARFNINLGFGLYPWLLFKKTPDPLLWNKKDDHQLIFFIWPYIERFLMVCWIRFGPPFTFQIWLQSAPQQGTAGVAYIRQRFTECFCRI